MRWFGTITLAAVLALSAGTAAAQAAAPDQHRHHHHHDHPMASAVHRAMYMQLLADRYAPETSAAWKEALSERGKLLKQLHEMQQASKDDGQERREKMRRFISKNGEALKARQELSNEFTEAVRSGDEAQIKAVLPKLLQAEQALNASLKKWMQSEKKGKFK